MTHSFNNLEHIVSKLHKLNFGEDGLIGLGADYCFKRYGGKHELFDELKVCTQCECPKSTAFTRITHGTHTFDFLDAHNIEHNTVDGWSQRPVLFIMENPNALDTRTDFKVEKAGKYVCGQWYWIHGQAERENAEFLYPRFFAQGEYGRMIYSVIRTFKMANAYVTNMVKCGMTHSGNDYLTTDEYREEIVETCMAKHLKEELKCLCGNGSGEPIVFTFGDRTCSRVKTLLGVEPVCLPHPANRLADDYRKYVLFGKIAHTLLQNHFYDGGMVKPDLEQLLSVKDDRPEQSFEEFCIAQLEEACKPRYTVKKRKSYDPERSETTICYAFAVNADNETESLILRHALKPEEGKYAVSWAEYRFDTDEISLYAGEKNTSNVFIDAERDKERFPIYGILSKLRETYREEYKKRRGADGQDGSGKAAPKKP